MTHDFHALRIAAVRRETRDCVSLGLEVPQGQVAAFAYKPGQHLAVRAMLEGEEVRRTYSISSGPDDALVWITIKRVPGGAFSTWAHESLRAGGTLESLPPSGRFVLPESDGTARRMIAVAAGSGITPVISILENMLAREPRGQATLIYGNRAVDDIVFRERIEALKDRNLGRLQVMHVLSRDAEADVPLLAGRIDAEKLRAILATVPRSEHDHAFLCGPDTLIKTARQALLDLGMTQQAIHFEYFRAGPRTASQPRPSLSPDEPAAVGAEAVAIVDGTRRTFRVGADQHVVDAALAQGIKLPYSCKGGMCCTCRAKLVEGEVTMDRNFSLETWEMEAGFVLTCQARPTTPRVVLDYDQV
jgi:ring-1,2-phenylacetyl-CoA epoxidase subunit PaaE